MKETSIGDTYNHLVEKGGDLVTKSESSSDGPFDMIYYPDVTRGNQFTMGLFAVDSSGNTFITTSNSFHFIFGGHYSISFNVTEFINRRRN